MLVEPFSQTHRLSGVVVGDGAPFISAELPQYVLSVYSALSL